MNRNIISITIILLSFQINHLKGQCWAKISGGEYHVLAISNDGQLFGWGINENHQLGDGTNINRNLPTLISEDANWIDISAGLHHSLALKNDGTLWAWGRNNYYQLGDGTNIDKVSPIKIGLDNNWISISAGTLFSIGLKSDGTLWVWGNSSSGQLGLGNVQSAIIPTKINDSNNWNYITTGNKHSIATKLNGSLWGWGSNGINMQIGAGEIQLVTEPIEIESSETWKEIKAGIYHNILLDSNSKIWTIGDNNYGQLGDSTFEDKGYLTKISNEDWKTVASGRTHCAAISVDGSLWTWGRNISAQLGNGNFTNSNTPINVGTQLKWSKIIAGIGYTMGIDENGHLWAVGSNDYGQLGNGSFEESVEFIEIGCPQATNVKKDKSLDSNMQIYPNPVSQSLYLDWRNISGDRISCSIYGINGIIVIPTFEIDRLESINVLNLKSGIYYLKVLDINKNIALKFIKINAM